MGNEFDEKINLKLKSLNIKTELYQRYADDVDLVVRTVGRKIKFCPEAGKMKEKTALEIQDEEGEEEDEITMKEMKKRLRTQLSSILKLSMIAHLDIQSLSTKSQSLTLECGWKKSKLLP